MLLEIIKKLLPRSNSSNTTLSAHDTTQLIQKAMIQHQAGNLQEAEKIYQSVLKEQPNNPDALHLLGLLAHQVGNNEVAVNLIQKAIEINPDIPDFYNNCGEAYLKLNNLDSAIACYEQAIAIRPDYVEAYNNMGNALKAMGKIDKAITCFEKALVIKPDFFQGHYNFGAILQIVGKLEEAVSHYQQAISIKPDYAAAHNNLGITLQEMGKHDEAIKHYQEAISIKPDYAEAHNNLGITLQEMGKHDEAIKHYQEAISIKPDYAEAHFNLSFLYLLVGDFENGWKEYEWRGKLSEHLAHKHSFSKPEWNGQSLNNKSLLLYAEQGIGDVIQFARFIDEIAALNCHVILACHKELHTLLSGTNGISKLIGFDGEPENYDFHYPLLSIPFMLKTTLDTIPNIVPYISTEKKHIELWKEKIIKDKNKLNIGIVWAGNPDFKKDRARSPGLNVFKELFSLDNINFYSLQMGEGKKQLNNSDFIENIVDLTDDLNDFNDTAALMSGLDLIISSCTSPLHLAGALGLPTWAILSKPADWRWLLDNEYSPWYPTMRLFRQKHIGDWDTVINKIKKELEKIAAT